MGKSKNTVRVAEEEMAQIFHRYTDILSEMVQSDTMRSAQFQNANADLWAVVEQALALHQRTQVPIPQEMTFAIREELQFLLAGLPAPRLRLLTGKGRKVHPDRRAGRVSAVMYHVAVSQGLVTDKAPRKTLYSLFGVAPSTLQVWLNKFKKEAQKELQNFWPDLPPSRRAKLLMVRTRTAANVYNVDVKVPPVKHVRSRYNT